MSKKKRDAVLADDAGNPNNFITSVIGAAILGVIGLILSNLRVEATMGLGDFEATVDKEAMGMPRYSTRKTNRVIEG